MWDSDAVSFNGADLPQDFLPDGLSTEWHIVMNMAERSEFEDEVAREVRPGHPLHGHHVHVVVFRRHKKEIVCWLPSAQEWACVHLTWTVESNPRWPSTVIVNDWADVLAELAEQGRP